jgi:hypothetical protein
MNEKRDNLSFALAQCFIVFEGGEAFGVRRLDAALNIKISEIASCEGGVKPPHSKGALCAHLSKIFL